MTSTASVPVIVADPAGGTRDRILREADALFARHGYAAVSMRQVALASGVTKPALYYHFRDKDSLFEECLRQDRERLGGLVRAAAEHGESLTERVTALASALLAGSPHHPVLTQADTAEHLGPAARQRVASAYSDIVLQPVSDCFERAAVAGELRDGVSPATATSALIGLCLAFRPARPAADADLHVAAWPGAEDAEQPPTDHVAATIADLVVRGVALTTPDAPGD